MFRGVRAATGIVICQPSVDVGGQSNVIARRGLGVLQHIDMAFVLCHAEFGARQVPARIGAEYATGWVEPSARMK
jgi:hypothetical protein